MIAYIDPLYTHNSGLQAIQHYRYPTHFPARFTHALGFSFFTSRILATDFSQSHCSLISQMKSSLHILITFLPLVFTHPRLTSLCSLLQLPVPEFDQILTSPLSCSYPGRIASQNSTRLNSTELFFISTLHGPRRKHSLYIFWKAY
jgi:hypothetical protein